MEYSNCLYSREEILRSYSSIFSSTSFDRLIKEDDYSFIDSKIIRFDSHKLGKAFITYFEYLKYVYAQLVKEYRCEYVYKNTLINELLIKKYGASDSVVYNEFKVGNSIADMVLFNGTSKAFEIKTELDSDKRLDAQLSDYTKIFRKCYIVTHESLVEKYMKLSESAGVIALYCSNRSLKLEEVRKPIENTHMDADVLIRSLRTAEYKGIVNSYFKRLPEATSFTMYKKCRDLLYQIPDEELHHFFIEELKKRKTNSAHLQSFFKEIRQLCLSLNINTLQYKQLEVKLNNTIKL